MTLHRSRRTLTMRKSNLTTCKVGFHDSSLTLGQHRSGATDAPHINLRLNMILGFLAANWEGVPTAKDYAPSDAQTTHLSPLSR